MEAVFAHVFPPAGQNDSTTRVRTPSASRFALQAQMGAFFGAPKNSRAEGKHPGVSIELCPMSDAFCSCKMHMPNA